MKRLTQLVKESAKRVYDAIGPEVKIDEHSRSVEIRDGLFFGHITQAYYTFKGYNVDYR